MVGFVAGNKVKEPKMVDTYKKNIVKEQEKNT
jgi:hypothetical protein